MVWASLFPILDIGTCPHCSIWFCFLISVSKRKKKYPSGCIFPVQTESACIHILSFTDGQIFGFPGPSLQLVGDEGDLPGERGMPRKHLWQCDYVVFRMHHKCHHRAALSWRCFDVHAKTMIKMASIIQILPKHQSITPDIANVMPSPPVCPGPLSHGKAPCQPADHWGQGLATGDSHLYWGGRPDNPNIHQWSSVLALTHQCHTPIFIMQGRIWTVFGANFLLVTVVKKMFWANLNQLGPKVTLLNVFPVKTMETRSRIKIQTRI